MPTLMASKLYNAQDVTIIKKVFDANCKFLGIAHRDFTVYVRPQSLQTRLESNGNDYFAVKEMGRMRQLDESETKFIVEINNKNSLYNGLDTVCHEMIHVRQYLMGHMKETPRGTLWRNKFWPAGARRTDYLNIPWEREAHGNQAKVFKNALQSLTEGEIAYAHKRFHTAS